MNDSRSTVKIRVWNDVKKILKEISVEHGYAMSDLASTLLLEALRNPHLLAYTLEYWFNVDFDEALKTSLKISQEVDSLLRLIEEYAEEAMRGEDVELKEAETLQP